MTLDFKTTVWSDNSGNAYTSDEVIAMIKSQIVNYQKIHIGSDSHRARKSKHVAVATAICCWSEEIRQGGWYCFVRKNYPRKTFSTLYERLFHEAQASVDIACFLRDEVGLSVESVHVNVNTVEDEASSKYATSIKGFVEAFGFECKLKPDDWAAGGVADKHAR